MIRQKTVATNRTLPLLRDFLGAFPELAVDAVERRLARTVTPHLLDELRYTPPTVKHPFVWSFDPVKNARARRWWFANNSGPYKRTGALSRSWKITFMRGKQSISMRVTNNRKGASYVVGSLNGKLGQVPGHKTSGWPLAAPTISFWQVAAREEAHEAVKELINARK